MHFRREIFPQYLRQLAAAVGDEHEAYRRIVAIHGADSLVARAAVGGIGSSEVSDLAEARADWNEQPREQAIVGRLQWLNEVPLGVKLPSIGAGTNAGFVPEGGAVPLSKAQLSVLEVVPRRIGGILVATEEFFASNARGADQAFARELTRVAVEARDAAFCADWSSSDEAPESITFGAPTTISADDLGTDCEAAIANFTGDLTKASWIMHPRIAAAAALRWGQGGGLAADLGVRGGSLLGCPVLCSPQVPYDSSGSPIALVDASQILYGEEGPQVMVSRQATLEMDSTPAMESLVPTSASGRVVSLFQSGSVAVKITLRVGWVVARSGAVSVITGATYPQVS